MRSRLCGPGDILLHLVPGDRSRKHVQLFDRWADPDHNRAFVTEQSGLVVGMRSRVIAVSAEQSSYLPFRYRHIL